MTSRQTANPWIICHRPALQAGLRLFCFPYAGGGASIFRTWPDSLPHEIEVCLIELPGRGARLKEKPYTSVTLLVQAIAQALLPSLDKPFAFYGHSMGAMISFELARYLRRECGLIPIHLFVSGHKAPQSRRTESPWYNLPESDFLEKLRRLKGTPDEVLGNQELMQLIIPLLRADFELVQTYKYSPEPPLSCPITAFGGLDDYETSGKLIENWRSQTIASFSQQMLPGDHFFLHTAQSLLIQSLSLELCRLVKKIAG